MEDVSLGSVGSSGEDGVFLAVGGSEGDAGGFFEAAPGASREEVDEGPLGEFDAGLFSGFLGAMAEEGAEPRGELHGSDLLGVGDVLWGGFVWALGEGALGVGASAGLVGPRATGRADEAIVACDVVGALAAGWAVV